MRIDIKRITRSHEWWDHKTPQVLSLGYATAIVLNSSLFTLLGTGFLTVFVCLIVIAVYASIINDLTDMEIDRLCGKSNLMTKLSPGIRLLILSSALVLVMMAAWYIYPDSYSVIFYLLIAITISLYSFPPVRLKKRGIWGVLSCGAAEHLFPTLFTVSIVYHLSGSPIRPIWLCATGILSLMYGIRSILWHQFLDRENDQQSAIRTFASRVNPEQFKSYALVIFILELLALFFVVYLLHMIIVVIFLIAYIFFVFCRSVFFKSKPIILITPENSYYQILMLDFYTIFFPFALLCYVSATQEYGWCVLLIHTLLFYKTLLVTAKDMFYIFRDIGVRLKG